MLNESLEKLTCAVFTVSLGVVMADGNGKCSESGDQLLVTNQLAFNMNNNSSADAKISNGPEVSEDNKGITCAERTSNEARSSHALNKVSIFLKIKYGL